MSRTETTTRELYSFNELSDVAKAYAIDHARNEAYYPYEGWEEFIIENWTDKLEQLGYTSPDIAYSGFSRQGDGASFTCKYVDLAVWLKAHKLANKYRALYNRSEYASISVERNNWGHYVHNKLTYVDAQWLSDERGHVEVQLGEIEALMHDEAQELGMDIYRELESEYDAMFEDDYISENLIANDCEFNVLGAIE